MKMKMNLKLNMAPTTANSLLRSIIALQIDKFFVKKFVNML